MCVVLSSHICTYKIYCFNIMLFKKKVFKVNIGIWAYLSSFVRLSNHLYCSRYPLAWILFGFIGEGGGGGWWVNLLQGNFDWNPLKWIIVEWILIKSVICINLPSGRIQKFMRDWESFGRCQIPCKVTPHISTIVEHRIWMIKTNFWFCLRI